MQVFSYMESIFIISVDDKGPNNLKTCEYYHTQISEKRRSFQKMSWLTSCTVILKSNTEKATMKQMDLREIVDFYF